MNSKKIDYDWVCHACSVENGKHLIECQACGCSAFASMQTIEHHASEQRKADFQLSRDLAMQILFWAVIGVIAVFFQIRPVDVGTVFCALAIAYSLFVA